MKTILIADAGGTSTDWRLIKNGEISSFKTKGFNPQSHSINHFIQEIKTLGEIQADEIYLYIAGAETIEEQQRIEKQLLTIFGIKPKVEHDLLAAGRALFRNDSGYACILGTGSNVGYYDGDKIDEVGRSLGYLVGDEGSGFYLGKQLVKARYRGGLSDELNVAFDEYFNKTQSEVINELYSSAHPNQFLASFSPFLLEFKEQKEIQNIFKTSFEAFFKAYFSEKTTKTLSFVGSIAFHYQDFLRQTAQNLDFHIDIIIQSPIDALAHYHVQC